MMVWLGVSYAMGASAMWPMVSFILPSHVLGTAYGLMTAIQNFGTSLAPQLIGYLQDRPGIKDTPLMYTVPILLFVTCAATSLVISLVLLGGTYVGCVCYIVVFRELLQKRACESLLSSFHAWPMSSRILPHVRLQWTRRKPRAGSTRQLQSVRPWASPTS